MLSKAEGTFFPIPKSLTYQTFLLTIDLMTSEELTHSMAHYLLSIHKLKEEKGQARVTDIALELGLTKGSVSVGLANLKKKGLVIEGPDSKLISLSEVGHQHVHQILAARMLLFHFFKDFLGVDTSNARQDACSIEHLLGEQTREKFFRLLKEVGCSCHQEKAVKLSERLHAFRAGIDLCDFNNFEQFINAQKADYQLN